MTHSKFFRYQAITLRVAVEDRRDLLWLEEFLGPQFRTLRQADPDCSVILKYGPETYQELLDRGPSKDLPPQDGFAQDTKTERFAIYAKAENVWTVFDEALGVFYVRDQAAKCVTIIHNGKDRWRARFSLMRVVRELAMTHMVGLGQPILHAAAFARGQDGFAISGSKKAGKTSLLIHILQRGDLKYVSNDRLFADVGRSGARICGLPTVVTLRESTLTHYPALEQTIREGGYSYMLTLAEARRKMLGPSEVDWAGRFNLTARQFCDLLGVRAQAGARLKALLFPRIDPNAKRIEVSQLNGGGALPKIQAGLFRAGFSTQVHDFFALAEPGKTGGDAKFEKTIQELAAKMPAFECRIGPDAYGDHDWLEEILETAGVN